MPVPIDKLNYALSSTCLQMEDLCGRLSMFGARNSYNIFRWSDEVCNQLAIQVEGFLIKSSIESVEAKHQFRPSCLAAPWTSAAGDRPLEYKSTTIR